MKKVVVFCVAFMFVAINVCSAQAERVEKRTAEQPATQNEAVTPSTTTPNAATDVVRPEPRPVVSDDAVKPGVSDAVKPGASDAVKPSVSDQKQPTQRNAKPAEPKKRTAEPAPKPTPKPADNKKQTPSGTSQR